MLGFLLTTVLAAQAPTPATPALVPLPPADVHLDGCLGARVEANRRRWLATVDRDARIEPFAHRPAKQPWAGEHLGKWMHAASLAWASSGDEASKARLDRAAAALLAAQEDDGYLGTYLPDKRFQLLPGADWDVWTIKYALLGLLEYHAVTGSVPALDACKGAADQLLATFGAGKKSILAAGTHVGMAATSVLEPIARLYRRTGDARYLAFARYFVQSWDESGGARIAATLCERGRVAATANGKAYDMLSNVVGLCDGQTFTLQLDKSITAVALRVVGVPACGDNGRQDFSSCAELSARR